MPGLLERVRAASIAQDADGLAGLYAVDAVHEFRATVYRALPLRYTAYRTSVVEQEALGGAGPGL